MKIHFLTTIEIKRIHINQIDSYGGMHGIRDLRLLDSATHYPQATFEKQYLQPDIYHMAAGYITVAIAESKISEKDVALFFTQRSIYHS